MLDVTCIRLKIFPGESDEALPSKWLYRSYYREANEKIDDYSMCSYTEKAFIQKI